MEALKCGPQSEIHGLDSVESEKSFERNEAQNGGLESVGIFGRYAEEMVSHGLAVLPVTKAKKPAIAGFNTWTRRPTRRTVSKWAEKHADLNVGIIPGLSGLWIADVDDVAQADEVEALLGPTQFAVESSRGMHLYYKAPDKTYVGSLHKRGFKVDLKAGNSVVVAPPSIHESGHRYEIVRADWTALPELPLPNVENLEGLLANPRRDRFRGRHEMRDGSRGQALNDYLCSQVGHCDSFDDLLDVAHTFNANLAKWGFESLSGSEVVARTQQVWTDYGNGKIEVWHRGGGVAKARKADLHHLARLDSGKSSDAFAFLAILRIEHSARCKRSDTFAITPRSMVQADVIPGWSRERYERARDLLVEAGFLVKVSSFKNTATGRTPAQYWLPE